MVLCLDAMQIVVPGAVSRMSPTMKQRYVVEFPNGVMVGGTISANLHRHCRTGHIGRQWQGGPNLYSELPAK